MRINLILNKHLEILFIFLEISDSIFFTWNECLQIENKENIRRNVREKYKCENVNKINLLCIKLYFCTCLEILNIL